MNNEVQSLTELTAVQAGADTPLSNRRGWQFHAERINAAWGKQVESIFETSRYLVEAHDEMDRSAFETMVHQKLIVSPSTARKLIVIARDPVLINCARWHKLPPSWGTLYELTKLPAEALRAKLNDGSINPKTERKDVAAWRAEQRGVVEVGGKRIERRPSVAEQLKAAKAEIAHLKNIVGGEHLFDPSNTNDRQIAETMIGRLEGWRGRARKVARLMLEILDRKNRGGKKSGE